MPIARFLWVLSSYPPNSVNKTVVGVVYGWPFQPTCLLLWAFHCMEYSTECLRKPRAAFLLFWETASIPRAFVLLPGYRRPVRTPAPAHRCASGTYRMQQLSADLVGRDGSLIAETHSLREKLGDGGTAQVWAAVCHSSGETVALKMTSKADGHALVAARCVPLSTKQPYLNDVFTSTSSASAGSTKAPPIWPLLLSWSQAEMSSSFSSATARWRSRRCARSRSSLAQRWHTYIRWAFCIAT